MPSPHRASRAGPHFEAQHPAALHRVGCRSHIINTAISARITHVLVQHIWLIAKDHASGVGPRAGCLLELTECCLDAPISKAFNETYLRAESDTNSSTITTTVVVWSVGIKQTLLECQRDARDQGPGTHIVSRHEQRNRVWEWRADKPRVFSRFWKLSSKERGCCVWRWRPGFSSCFIMSEYVRTNETKRKRETMNRKKVCMSK